MIGIPSSLSLIIHLGILIFKRLISLFRLLSPKYLKSTIIMLVVASFSIMIILSVFHLNLSTENNFQYLQAAMKSCPIDESNISNKNVILRIDDVQANVWTDISINMVTDAININAPVSLGIIPKGLDTDTKLVSFLKQNNCNIEMAQHGWDHQTQDISGTPEFANLSYNEAKDRIQKGKKELEAISTYPISTFIPPQNTINNNTDQALHDLGFNVVSDEGKKYFDYTTSPYDWSKEEFIQVDEIIQACEKEFTKKDLCVIMLHPQDYTKGNSFDVEKYEQYKTLLTKLKEQNYNLTTFHQYTQTTTPTKTFLLTRINNISRILFSNGIFVVMLILTTIWFAFLILRKIVTKKSSK